MDGDLNLIHNQLLFPSDFMRSLIIDTFSSALAILSDPEQTSASMVSQPYRSIFDYLKTWARVMVRLRKLIVTC